MAAFSSLPATNGESAQDCVALTALWRSTAEEDVEDWAQGTGKDRGGGGGAVVVVMEGAFSATQPFTCSVI